MVGVGVGFLRRDRRRGSAPFPACIGCDIWRVRGQIAERRLLIFFFFLIQTMLGVGGVGGVGGGGGCEPGLDMCCQRAVTP